MNLAGKGAILARRTLRIFGLDWPTRGFVLKIPIYLHCYRTLIRGKWVFSPSRRQAEASRRALSNASVEKTAMILSLFENRRPNVLDLGANIGYTARLYGEALGRLGISDGCIYCVEPYTPNFEYISRNLRGLVQWRLIPLALGDRTTFVNSGIPIEFSKRGRDGRQNTGLVSTTATQVLGGTGMPLAQVEASDLIRWLPALDTIALIKIDIEGSELAVLGSAPELLRSGAIIEMEINPTYFGVEESVTLDLLLQSNDLAIVLKNDFDFESPGEVYFIPRPLVSGFLRLLPHYRNLSSLGGYLASKYEVD